MKMRDQSVNKGKVKKKKRIRPKKYLIFGLWRRAKTDEKRRREEKEEEEEEEKRRRKEDQSYGNYDFGMNYYGFIWIFMVGDDY